MARDHRLLTAFGCLAVFGCGSGSAPAGFEAMPADRDGLTIVVAGELRQFDSATLRLCYS